MQHTHNTWSYTMLACLSVIPTATEAAAAATREAAFAAVAYGPQC